MEPPNKLMIMRVLGCFRYYSMILNGLTRIFSGASCVIRGVLGEIGVIRASRSVPWPSWPCSSTGGTPRGTFASGFCIPTQLIGTDPRQADQYERWLHDFTGRRVCATEVT